VKDSRILDFVEIVNAGESGCASAITLRRKKQRASMPSSRRKASAPSTTCRSASTSRHGKRTSTPSRRPTSSSNDEGVITEDLVNARRQGNFVLVNRAEVDYIDVSPKQLVSVAASLVPFLEHDDATAP